jgi:hypothetical protein
MTRVSRLFCALFALLMSQPAISRFDLLFNVSAMGNPANLNITLCLNGKGPLSCQNYTVSALNLSISTTIPNHVYPAAGIKINTPGYVLAGCTPTANGYCLFSANNTTPTNIFVSSTSAFSVGGTVSGLSGTMVLQNNGGNSQTIRSNGSFTFSTPIAKGSTYSVTVSTQPATQTCTVSNGSGTVGGTNVTNVNITCTNWYTGIYVETNNSLVTYSPNNGTTWGYMLSPQGGWEWDHYTFATAATTDGTMYQATGVQGSAATLIYSSDGVTWNQVSNNIPINSTNNDWVQSIFATGNTVYIGTGNGYVYYTTDQGISWLPNTSPQIPDGGTVNAFVVDTSGNFYAGTNNGNIYYSNNYGQSWTALTNPPTGGGSISSLAIDNSGTLYAVTANTTSQPQYNSAPLTTGTWQSMSALPGGDGNATAIAASGTTVYVGTNTSYVLYTSNLGTSWSGNQLPSGDTSGIIALFVGQTASLSPLFVESYGIIPIISSAGTGTITVSNLSNTTATNVQAESNQLPVNVTQSSAACASVASGDSCTITFSASGTNAFAPTAFNIIDGNGATIARSALVSSITPNSGTNYYYVYNVIGSTEYVIDNSDVSTGIIWSSYNSGNYDNGVAIYGISEASTASSPAPSTGQVAGQTACNGATDGSCDANNIYVYYQNDAIGAPISTAYYAEGLCYQSTNGSATASAWYLPAACELNGGIYLNVTTNQFESCSPVLTSIFSLYSLGALGGDLSSLLEVGLYWSSTEASGFPQPGAWYVSFNSGGGSGHYNYYKGYSYGVRCSQALAP